MMTYLKNCAEFYHKADKNRQEQIVDEREDFNRRTKTF